jgi:hypothetical protein
MFLSSISAVFPFVGACQVCMKRVILALLGTFLGADSLIRMSAMYAHVGCIGDMLRYSFCHHHVFSHAKYSLLALSGHSGNVLPCVAHSIGHMPLLC